MNVSSILANLVPGREEGEVSPGVWYIGRKFFGKNVILSRGFWFTRQRAEDFLRDNPHFGKKARVMRISDLDSSDLYELRVTANVCRMNDFLTSDGDEE